MARKINPRHLIHTIPMFRYALLLLLGIIIAECSLSVLGVREWLFFLCCLVGCALMVNKRHEMASSLLILLAIVSLGGLRYCFHAEDAWIVAGDGNYDLELVIADEPIRRGKVVQFEGIVAGTGGDAGCCGASRHLEGRRLRVSLLRDTITRRYESLHIGQSIIADVDISPLKDWHRMNGNFDYIRWQTMRGIVGRGFIGIGKWEFSDDGFSALGFWEKVKLQALVWRESLLERIKGAGLSGDEYAVLTAMALGNKSALTSELREEYSMSGVSHILALSGMHLSIIYMLLTYFMPRRNVWNRLLVLGMLWGYVIFVGMPLSVVRAASMLTIWEVVWLMDRDQKQLNVWGTALAVMLMANPESFWDVGFQMSFMAVFGIIVCQPLSDKLIPVSLMRIKRVDEQEMFLWNRVRYRSLRCLWYTACVSVSAQLGTVPLSAYYFGRVSVYFLFANFVVIPCATVIISGAFLLTAIIIINMVAGGGLPIAAVAVAAILSAIITAQNSILSFIAWLPGSSIEDVHIGITQVMALYAMVYALLLVLYRLVRWR